MEARGNGLLDVPIGISWNVAAMLHNIVIMVVCTCPRSMLLAMLTMR